MFLVEKHVEQGSNNWFILKPPVWDGSSYQNFVATPLGLYTAISCKK